MSEITSTPTGNYPNSGDETPSQAVVRAVAAAEGVDETELRPLYDVCDPDALDSLFQPTPLREPSHVDEVRFRYHGYTVLVNGDGQVQLLD